MAFVLTLVAALAGLRLQRDGIAVFWPAAGVIAGLVLASAGRCRQAVVAGALLALTVGNTVQLRSPSASIVFMIGNIGQALLVAALIDRWYARPFRLDTVARVGGFLSAAVLATAATAVATSVGLRWSGHAHGDFLEVWSIWFASHLVGMLAISPAVLATARRRPLVGPDIEDIAQAAAVTLVSLVIVGSLLPETGVAMLLVLVALGPLVLWVALRTSVERSSLALLAIAVATIWQTGSHSGVFAGNETWAQLFLAAIAPAMLMLGALRVAEQRQAGRANVAAGFRLLLAAAVLVPLFFFAAVAWWSWTGALDAARAQVQRLTTSAEENARRSLEVQEAVLEAALTRVRGMSFEEIAASREVQAFLTRLDRHSPSNRALALVHPANGRILSWSRAFPAPEIDVSQRDYFRTVRSDPTEIYVGETVRARPSGEIGFTISKHDERSGLLAVAHLPSDHFGSFYERTRLNPRDTTVLAREDGAVLARSPAPERPEGLRLTHDHVLLRFARGELRSPEIVRAWFDGNVRLYDARKVAHYPIYVAHGIDYASVRIAWLRQLGPFALLTLLAGGIFIQLSRRTQRLAEARRRAEVETASARARADRAELLAEREARLRQASAHLENALAAAEAGTWTQDLATGRRRSDARAARLFGLDEDAAAGGTQQIWLARIHPSDRSRVEAAVTEAMRTGGLYAAEYRIVLDDGSVRWVAGRGRATFAQDATPVAFNGIVIDITGRKLVEEQLRQREAELTRAQQIGKIGSYEVDLRGGAFRNRRSPEYLRIHGLSPEDAEESHEAWVSRIHPEDRVRAETAFKTAVRDGHATFTNEYRIVRPSDGETRWIAVYSEIDRNGAGEPQRLFGMHIDITDRKLAEEALRQSEERYRHLFESNPLPMWVYELATWRFLAVNDAAVAHYGYARNEFLTMTLADILPAEDVPRLQAFARDADTRLERATLWRHRKKSGDVIDVEMTAHVLEFEGRPAALILANDVTERRRAELELMSANGRLELAQEAGRVGAWEYVPGTSGLVKWPASFYAALGYDSSQMPSLALFHQRVHPDDRLLLDETRNAEASAADGARFRIELRLVLPSGETRWIERRSQVVSELGGRRVIGINIDLTERKQKEQQIMLLMREVNHRSKNLLSVVQAIARHTAAGNAKDFAQTFAHRVSALAASQDLLVKTEWQGVDVEDLVRSQLAHVDELVDSRVSLGGPPLRLSAAAAQTIGMALHELCTNACKYGALSNEVGRVAIEWRIKAVAGQQDRFTMSWSESGGPPVTRPQRSGFGTTVVDTMARMGLGGSVQIDYQQAGVVWNLECPAVNALEKRA